MTGERSAALWLYARSMQTPTDPRHPSPTPPAAGLYPHVSEWPFETLRTITRATLLLKIYFIDPLLLALILGGILGAATSGTFNLSSGVMATVYGLSFVLGIVATGVMTVGTWRVSAPMVDEAHAAPGGPRVVLRKLMIAYVVVYGVSLVASMVQLAVQGVPIAAPSVRLTTLDLVVSGIGLIALAVAAAWYGVLAWHLSHLAVSIDNQKAQRRATTAIWLLPVLSTVGILACGLGPLIALVLAYNLLTVFRKALVIEVEALRPDSTPGFA